MFWEKTSSDVSPARGILVPSFFGMYTSSDFGSLKYSGGKCIPFPLYSSSFMILFKFSMDEIAVESINVAFTYFSCLRYMRRAPQKVRPKPIKAKIEDAKIIELTSATIPQRRIVHPTALEKLRFGFAFVWVILSSPFCF